MDIIILALCYGTLITILIRMLIDSIYWRKIRKLTKDTIDRKLLNGKEMSICIRALQNMNLNDVYKPWKQIPTVKYYNTLKSLCDN